MAGLLVSLLPLALGIVLSPLAVVAAVAVLVSPRARANSVAFLAGWVLGIVVVLAVSAGVLVALGVEDRPDPPGWVGVVHVVLGVVLLLGAVWVLLRQRHHLRVMAAAGSPAEVTAAAPQLPGWLHSVDTFTAARSAALGFGLFALNPIDASCAVGAALDLVLQPVDRAPLVIAGLLFLLVSASSVAVPVGYVLLRGPAAAPVLDRARHWIAGHTRTLNALLLVIIGGLQLSKVATG